MANPFDELTARNEHAAEIAQTRVGYLGGSDAKMVYKVALNSIGALTTTDIKRLNICCGNIENVPTFGGTAATERGHDFEDYIAKTLPLITQRDDIEREKFIEGRKYNHFTTMCHADFKVGATVYECKCVMGKTTTAVVKTYYAQLQWYYMLGVENVVLIHGSDANTIEELVPIPKNEGYVAMLERGCEIIDTYCNDITKAEELMSIPDYNAPREVQEMLRTYKQLQDKIKDYTSQAEKIKSHLYTAMISRGIGEVKGDISAKYIPDTVTRTIDKRKLLAAFPDVATADVYTESKRNGYIRVSFS